MPEDGRWDLTWRLKSYANNIINLCLESNTDTWLKHSPAMKAEV